MAKGGKIKQAIFINLVFLLLPVGFASAATRLVPQNYATIQAAIDGANNGDTIIVSPGTYDENIDFGNRKVVLTSIDPNDAQIVAATTIKGKPRTRKSVVTFADGQGSETILTGFTITNGNGTEDDYDPTLFLGVGIYCKNTSPTIRCNVITGNDGPMEWYTPVVNRSYGGGIYCTNSNAVIERNIIKENSAYYGGGIMAQSSDVTITNNLVYDNLGLQGGGVHLQYGGQLINNTLVGNWAYSNPYYYSGGNVYVRSNQPNQCVVANNIIFDADDGGGIYWYSYNQNFSMEYNNVYNNYGGNYYVDPWLDPQDYLSDQTGINGNISEDPLFVDAFTKDYHLQSEAGRWIPSFYARLDLVDDGFIDLFDFAEFASFWLQEGQYISADFDDSGVVDWSDLKLIVDNYLTSPVPGTLVFDDMTSPCIDAGTNSPAPAALPTEDFDQTARPIDGDADTVMTADMGAYEYYIPFPKFSISPVQLAFFAVESGANPDSQIVSIRNRGSESLNWKIAYDCQWLEVDPNVGQSVGDTNEVTLSVNTQGLPRGSYSCQLTISDPNAMNSPRTLKVDLLIFTNLLGVPNPYSVIQTAIDSSSDGDAVVVEPGTYHEKINFNGRNITVSGTNPGDPQIVAATIIDADGVGTVVTFENSEGPDAVLTGFTITGGYGTFVDDYYEGAGIYCYQASPTIKANVITGNYCPNGEQGLYGYGGGICCLESSAVITGNIIRQNEAFCGAGIEVWNGDAAITNNLIYGNSAQYGGGVYLTAGGRLINNTLLGNYADYWGGNILVDSYDWEPSVILNNIITGALNAGGISWDGTEDYDYIAYNNLWGNVGGDYLALPVQTGINGNISEDPMFADAANGDYHLCSQAGRWAGSKQRWNYDDVTSRCIDAGNPGSGLGDELPAIVGDPDNEWSKNIRVNMGAYGGTEQATIAISDNMILADLTNDGIVDFDDLADWAENWLSTGNDCSADLNRNGIVDMVDFAVFAQDWFEQTGWH